MALYLVVAAGHLDDAARLQVRRDVLRVIGKIQARAGMDPAWMEVREATGGLHFNLIILLPSTVVDVVDSEARKGREVWRVTSPFDAALTGNATLGIRQPDRFARHNRPAEDGKGGLLLDIQMIQAGQLVDVLRYCLKEATPQAHAALKRSFSRVPGSHRLEVGGDRVRMSEGIEAALIRAGAIKPRRKVYARADKAHLSTHIHATKSDTVTAGDATFGDTRRPEPGRQGLATAPSRHGRHRTRRPTTASRALVGNLNEVATSRRGGSKRIKPRRRAKATGRAYQNECRDPSAEAVRSGDNRIADKAMRPALALWAS